MSSRNNDSGVNPTMPRSAAPLGMMKLIGRALRLACPVCGSGRMFSSWFTLRERCDQCAFRFERGETDYFIGAYTLHLIVAELIVVAVMLLWMFLTWPEVPWDGMIWGVLGLSIVGITATYPFSRSLWLAIDLTFRPVTTGEYAAGDAGAW